MFVKRNNLNNQVIEYLSVACLPDVSQCTDTGSDPAFIKLIGISMHEIGCSGLVHWDDPEGWDGEGDGRGFRTRNTYKPVVDSCQCMAKTTAIL